MKKLMIASTFLLTLNAFAYNDKGNGGDVVRCDGKLQTLDSVVMRQEGFFDHFQSTNHQDSLSTITEHLQQTLPFMAKKLNAFIEIYQKKGDINKAIYWIKGTPVDVRDENLFLELPENCEDPQQAVVRVASPVRRYYNNSKHLAELSREGDELSWLLVHEWLRDYVEDADVIRLLNSYFHSEQFLKASETEVLETLKKMGITNGYGAMASEIRKTEDYLRIEIPNAQARISSYAIKYSQWETETVRRKKNLLKMELEAEGDAMVIMIRNIVLSESAGMDPSLEVAYIELMNNWGNLKELSKLL